MSSNNTPSRLTTTSGRIGTSGRSSRRLTRTGKVSPAPTLRLGTETEALPPAVTSCAVTSSVTPRIRLVAELRSESDECRSMIIALPCAVVAESPKSADTSVTGESAGNSIFSEVRVSSDGCWATATAREAKRRTAALLRIDILDGHLTGIRIEVSGAERALGPHRIGHAVV